MHSSIYNPDVLSCLANLSNDEVFTPPEIVNQMLDMLPQELFSDSNTKFLDPACKSGVFLREIAKRLLKGLKDKIPDDQQRRDHIFQNQIYGIAITELTSLLSRRSVYCSKYSNSIYSVSPFRDVSGNIRFKRIPHRWVNEKCAFCGASQGEYGEQKREGLESHAYEFIHTTNPEEIVKMKFDVIIGNPPYQLSDAGNGMSAKPIYHHFVNQAKKLNPRFLTMIVPSRWFSGGKGLDEFRRSMLNDSHIRKLVDYENSAEVFNGVDIAGGICYFLWERDSKGICEVTNYYDGKPIVSERNINEYATFIRHGRSAEIVRKILSQNKKYLVDVVSARKPFGLPTNYPPQDRGVPCWFIQKIGLKYAQKQDITDSGDLLNKWKLLIPKAPIAGQTDFSKPVGFYYNGNVRIASPGECCTESWIVAGAFLSKEEVLSYKSYVFTKIVRFLILQTVVSQDVTKKNYAFVPDLGKYDGVYTDDILRNKWDITDEEWMFIDSRITTLGGAESGK
ncbi:MAG: Eco57I restriction-modification methylase domain-containing protein [Mariniphaga sp.]